MKYLFRLMFATVVSFVLFSSMALADTRVLEIGDNLNFGSVNVGESVTQELTLYNRGDSPLTIAKLRFHERIANVYSSNYSGVIPAGKEQNVTIIFTPKAGVEYIGLVYVESDRTNDGDRNQLLTGVGIDENGSIPTKIINFSPRILDFGVVNIGDMKTKELKIGNLGTGDLTIEGLRFHERLDNLFSTDFFAPVEIPSGGFVSTSITFVPTKLGDYAGLLYVKSDATNEGYNTVLILAHVVENSPPIVDAGEDIFLECNQTGYLTGKATDSDGEIVSYQWREGDTLLAETASFNYASNIKGAHHLTLFVTDNEGAVGSDSVDIEVRGGCLLPLIGLTGTYYGVNTQLRNISQFRSIIENNEAITTAKFIATKLDYGYGTGTVSQGDNLQKFFLKDDAFSLTNDPDSTTDGGINLLGQIYLDAGTYNFRVRSDDGYQIKIDDISVAEIDYNQSPTTTTHSSFTINQSGYHDIDIVWWDQGIEYVFKVELSKDMGTTYTILDRDMVYHNY